MFFFQVEVLPYFPHIYNYLDFTNLFHEKKTGFSEVQRITLSAGKILKGSQSNKLSKANDHNLETQIITNNYFYLILVSDKVSFKIFFLRTFPWKFTFYSISLNSGSVFLEIVLNRKNRQRRHPISFCSVSAWIQSVTLTKSFGGPTINLIFEHLTTDDRYPFFTQVSSSFFYLLSI